MSSDVNKVAAAVPSKGEALNRALDRSEQVHEKVEQAAVDLAAVNESLKDELEEGVPLARVENALNQSEAVEVKVQEAAAELVTVKLGRRSVNQVEIIEGLKPGDQVILSDTSAQDGFDRIRLN